MAITKVIVIHHTDDNLEGNKLYNIKVFKEEMYKTNVVKCKQ